MGKRRFSYRKKNIRSKGSNRPLADIVKDLKKAGAEKSDYRERSLKLHGLICAKCGREFGEKDRHLLTVHHRDGNHNNNPPDGSNWENLCAYCHEDEHSREILGNYLRDKESTKSRR